VNTTAARLVPWKGVGALIEVVASLHDAGVPVTLRIIGDGVCRSELEERVHAKGATAYVHFLGSLPRKELAREIARSHVFVLNTSYEGLSHQLIEVMSLGVPVVTTGVGGNKELITHEETGLIVPWNDVRALKEALCRIKDDDAFARSLRDRASRSLRKFEEPIIAEEFKSFFKTVCDL
jgi:glycosyltransferase involved in cell wall biosynthesis